MYKREQGLWKSSLMCIELKVGIPHFALWNHFSTHTNANTETMPIIFSLALLLLYFKNY